jgi:hypothetical protein
LLEMVGPHARTLGPLLTPRKRAALSSRDARPNESACPLRRKTMAAPMSAVES